MYDNQELLFKILSYSPGPFWMMLIFFLKQTWAMKSYDVFLFLLSIAFAAQVVPSIPALLDF